MGFDSIKILTELIPALRLMEVAEKGSGYKELEKAKEGMPDEVYRALKACLDNPKKEFAINLNYLK